MTRVVVRGAGDVGSAVAHRLFAAGYRVVLVDEPRPAHARRGMAFCDALHEGTSRLAGLLGKRARTLADLAPMLDCRKALPLTDAAAREVLDALEPEVLVDARMRKHELPAALRGQAPFTIGLGPNFVAGETVDAAIETAWGDDLGRVVRAGPTRPLAGDPRAIAGHSRDRYVRAPVAGVFRTAHAIGQAVAQGERVASLEGGVVLASPLDGVLRGLTHDGTRVRAGAKVIEVDPAGDCAAAFGLGERPLRIAEGVLEAIPERLRPPS